MCHSFKWWFLAANDLQAELHSWWCAVAQPASAVLLSCRQSSELSLFDSLCPCNWCCRPCTGCDLRRGCCCSCPGGGPCELRWGCCSCLGGGTWHGLLARGVWCNFTDLQGAKLTCHKQVTECVQSPKLAPQHDCLAHSSKLPCTDPERPKARHANWCIDKQGRRLSLSQNA